MYKFPSDVYLRCHQRQLAVMLCPRATHSWRWKYAITRLCTWSLASQPSTLSIWATSTRDNTDATLSVYLAVATGNWITNIESASSFSIERNRKSRRHGLSKVESSGVWRCCRVGGQAERRGPHLAHLSAGRGAWPARAQPRARPPGGRCARAQTSEEMPPILIIFWGLLPSRWYMCRTRRMLYNGRGYLSEMRSRPSIFLYLCCWL